MTKMVTIPKAEYTRLKALAEERFDVLVVRTKRMSPTSGAANILSRCGIFKLAPVSSGFDLSDSYH